MHILGRFLFSFLEYVSIGKHDSDTDYTLCFLFEPDMKLIHSVNNFNQFPCGCVLTIGNFDGVHRGHQSLLKRLKRIAKIRNLPLVVMIFEPQPLEILNSEQAPSRLTRLREKIFYLEKYSVDYVLCVRFDQNFATITAQNFIDNFIVKRLHAKFVAVGNDFRFGAGRRGDFFLLKKSGQKYGFDVTIIQTLRENGIRISSTIIRKMLAEDRLEEAEKFLGHPFIVSGRVIQGDGLGRTIGFPTANISLYRRTAAINGVYVVEVTGISKIPLPGIANIGTCPTVSGVRKQLEVHLLDISMNLYGYHIDVILRKKIRNEKKFASLNDLKIQISNDELMARNFFSLL